MKNGYQMHFKKMKANKNQFQAKKNNSSGQKMTVQKKKQPFPATALLGLICLLAGSWYGYEHSDKLESITSKVEIRLFGTAIANNQAATPAKNSSENAKKEEKKSQTESTEKKAAGSVNATMTAEELALFKSLDARKKELDSREAELKKLEEELHKQKVELDKKISQLDQLRGQIGNQLEEKVKVDQEQVDKLVSFYSNMRPQKAAKIIETLNEDLAVEVLRKMKKKEAAEIMNMLEPAKAQKLSERFAGYRK